jgi:hypothetical protein
MHVIPSPELIPSLHPQVVYVARNPKDALSSNLHHHRLMKIHDYQGTDDQLVGYFINGQRKRIIMPT